MKSSSLFVAASTVALMAVFTAGGHAHSSDGLLIAQMHGGGMQGQGMQGQGMQGQGMQGQGMQGQGMQGQGMQGMGNMESRGMGGSNMQMPSAGGCMQMCGGMADQGPQNQMMGAMGPGGTMPGQQMMMQGRMADLPTDRIDGRIAYLHAELRIAEAQMPTWNDFAGVLRANAKRVSDARPAAAPTSKSAADRLDEQERWLSARLDSVRALKPAYARLYAVLDDSQKKSADELLAPYLGVR